MNESLGWIGELASWLGKFIPRWTILDTTQSAVKFPRGRNPKLYGPGGIIFWWPASTIVKTYPIARQATDLRSQRLLTKDGKLVLVRTLIVYEIADLLPLMTEVWEPESTVEDIALSAVYDVVRGMTYEDLLKTTGVGIRLRQEAMKWLRPYGVKVLKMGLTDLAPTRVVALSHDLPPQTSSEFLAEE